ncbi:MAG: hypothetical protein HY060_09015 [Proteobacteria bacterium]|nr:hypothetical protein [Pseudomonadota bacterium]
MDVRRPIVLALALFALIAAASAGARAQTAVGYVAGIEDVPLMAGLAPTQTNDLVFDSPQGRIVIVNTQGPLERRTVQDFYARSLTELGWDRIGDSAFRREGEMLRLEFGQRAQLLTVRFTLSPVH